MEMELALIIAYAIIRYGSKALDLIKPRLGSLWPSFYAAYKAGPVTLAKWLVAHSALIPVIYGVLKAAGMA
ncbi:hypothetical protein HMPREF3291_00850 [Bacillus sp. HMSC76G11]|nr:hypothetical protein HMPREF3291_00850 [Bacillus sp. HMSC76G11]